MSSPLCWGPLSRTKSSKCITFSFLICYDENPISYCLLYIGIYIHCTWLPQDSIGFLKQPANHDVDDSRLLMLIYVIAADCVLDDDNSITTTMEDRPAKCHCYQYDHTWAKAMWNDYLSPYPLFDDKQFHQNFHISKAIYDTIRMAIWAHPFLQNMITTVVDKRLCDWIASCWWL